MNRNESITLRASFASKAVNEVIDTEREVQRRTRLARVSQVVDYIFYVIYALLGMRFLWRYWQHAAALDLCSSSWR